ncbi:polysaccharide pyruvyl transferase family protein [Sphingomonas ginkgonis]|uniref:Polysaccharide pyruvyl transferase family protein n=1 Tax=Sphingomonas ginkgonis TaxID=2315330 RepID=A0A3R9YLS3_9SPHN|nr:polysaccharide pyruvyl transferase family protein [Sphingomonas ginkgonis]RST30417.1 polysaccharide pyruvyl transferase family protein [Sphingomonas ginkgonis]
MLGRKSVGVLTFHKCINYGSYWQARCMVDGLEARGFHGTLLDHDCERVTLAEYRCALQPTLPVPTGRAHFGAYATKVRNFLDAFRHLPRTERFGLDDPGSAQPFETVVVGSDEVWNLRHPWYGGKPIFTGVGLPAERLVSYAASFGNHDAAWGIPDHYAERLKRFDHLSVRDENSRCAVAASTGREPAMVLDPVLQFGRPAPVGSGGYLLVYGHSFPDWYAAAVRAAADRHGLRVLSFGYRNDWADEQRVDAGPMDFPAVVAGAAGVATNFFHGCVFALLHDKPFVTTATEYRRNKLNDLTADLAAARHLVDERIGHDEFDALLLSPLDRRIGERIAERRQEGHDYLDAALG